MESIWSRVFDDLLIRTHGPMWFRLILQPLVAIVLGVLAGLRNARAGTRPDDPNYRRTLLRQALHDMGKVAIIGAVLDVIVQWIVLKTVYPGETLIVVFLIVVVPYQIVRTVVAMLARAWQSSAGVGE